MSSKSLLLFFLSEPCAIHRMRCIVDPATRNTGSRSIHPHTGSKRWEGRDLVFLVGRTNRKHVRIRCWRIPTSIVCRISGCDKDRNVVVNRSAAQGIVDRLRRWSAERQVDDAFATYGVLADVRNGLRGQERVESLAQDQNSCARFSYL